MGCNGLLNKIGRCDCDVSDLQGAGSEASCSWLVRKLGGVELTSEDRMPSGAHFKYSLA